MEHTTDRIEISPMNQDDLMDVFNLSNQDSVRANSFQTQRIPLDVHTEWFKKKLADPNTKMFKLLDNGKFAGQIRLGIENNQAVISISVDEKSQGKGFGSRLVDFAISFLRLDMPEIDYLLAYTKKENAASIALFEKFNFKSIKNLKPEHDELGFELSLKNES
ncbi:MAG: GNAT family N-acetyltransferase [Armatimonadota bacterium]